MTKRKGFVIFLAFALVLSMIFAGCTARKPATQNNTGNNLGMPATQADNLARAAQTVPGVTSAYAVVSGTTAYVGIDLDRNAKLGNTTGTGTTRTGTTGMTGNGYGPTNTGNGLYNNGGLNGSGNPYGNGTGTTGTGYGTNGTYTGTGTTGTGTVGLNNRGTGTGYVTPGNGTVGSPGTGGTAINRLNNGGNYTGYNTTGADTTGAGGYGTGTSGTNTNTTNNSSGLIGIGNGRIGNTTDNIPNIKRAVANAVKSADASITTVYVSTDPSFMNRVRTVGQNIRNGKTITDFRNELNSLVRGIKPEIS